MSSNTPGASTGELGRLLRRVRSALEDLPSGGVRTPGKRSSEAPRQRLVEGASAKASTDNGPIEARSSVLSSKEVAFLNLREEVIGFNRNFNRNLETKEKLGANASAFPPVHKILLRSASTPGPPKYEDRNSKNLLRRRKSGLSCERLDRGDKSRDSKKQRKRRSGLFSREHKTDVELLKEIDSFRENNHPECAKILTFVKSSPWDSRESLFASTMSLFSSEDDARSFASSRADLLRSVSEETLTSIDNGPVLSGFNGNENVHVFANEMIPEEPNLYSAPSIIQQETNNGLMNPKIYPGLSNVFDSIPHIDSSSEEEHDFRSRLSISSNQHIGDNRLKPNINGTPAASTLPCMKLQATPTIISERSINHHQRCTMMHKAKTTGDEQPTTAPAGVLTAPEYHIPPLCLPEEELAAEEDPSGSSGEEQNGGTPHNLGELSE